MYFNFGKKLAPLACACIFAASAGAASFPVKSPDGRIEMVFNDGEKLTMSMSVDGKPVIENAAIGMKTDKGELGANAQARSSYGSEHRSEIENPFGIRRVVPDNYNTLTVEFDNYKLVSRVYDDCAAYRFVSAMGGGEMTVFGEELALGLGDDVPAIAHIEDGDGTSFEKVHARVKVGELKDRHSSTLPFIFEKGGVKTAVLESDLHNYPAMRLAYGDGGMRAYSAKYPKSLKPSGSSMMAAETEEFIAKTVADRAFPWRIFVVAREDKDLAVNDAVYRMASPARVDSEWVEPGMSIWEWWSDWNLEGVDFKSGMNRETYTHLIDFASEHDVPYLLIDAGWLDETGVAREESVLKGKLRIDIPGIIAEAAEKDVKVVLWLFSSSLFGDAAAALDKIKEWGAAGIKVDFTDRDDQTAIEFYERIARLAAERGLVVDFHGCAKPAGLNRTYPNVLNFEGVRGGEFNKFASDIEPPHNVDLIFTRMLTGPMDYTPGSMSNVRKEEFKIVGENPMTMGTRANQVAMFVLYFAPYQVMCDSVTQYERNEEVFDFISKIPTVWDDSVALDGRIGEYAVVARRSGDTWYVGGMNDWNAREVEVDLGFLDRDAAYKAEIIRDGANVGKLARDYKHEVVEVKPGRKLKIEMAPGGGFAVKLTKKKFDFFGIELF